MAAPASERADAEREVERKFLRSVIFRVTIESLSREESGPDNGGGETAEYRCAHGNGWHQSRGWRAQKLCRRGFVLDVTDAASIRDAAAR